MNAAEDVEQVCRMKAQIQEVARKEVFQARRQNGMTRRRHDMGESPHEQFEHLVTMMKNGKENFVRDVVFLRG